MTYDAKMAAAEAIVQAHNATIPPELSGAKVNWSFVREQILVYGGSSEENLRSMTWEDLQECGVPKLLARRIANECFRTPIKTPKEKEFKIPLTETRVAGMTVFELLRAFDPSGETNSFVTKRLTEVSFGKPFIIYVDDKVDVEASTQLLKEIRRKEPPRKYLDVGGVLREPKTATWVKTELFNENPLIPGTALREDDTCPTTGRSWKGIELKPRQIIFLAVSKTHELSVATVTQIQDVMDKFEGRSQESLYQLLVTRCPQAVLSYRTLLEEGKLTSLKIHPDPSKEGRKENPFGTHTTT